MFATPSQLSSHILTVGFLAYGLSPSKHSSLSPYSLPPSKHFLVCCLFLQFVFLPDSSASDVDMMGLQHICVCVSITILGYFTQNIFPPRKTNTSTLSAN